MDWEAGGCWIVVVLRRLGFRSGRGFGRTGINFAELGSLAFYAKVPDRYLTLTGLCYLPATYDYSVLDH